MAVKRRKRKPGSLSHGRPATLKKPTPSLSAKATRTLIRSHHRLEKALTKAEKEGDAEAIAQIRKQISDQGGLESYQQASITGQSTERGGDSSKVLLEWLEPHLKDARAARKARKVTVLEVGALSIENAISQSAHFEVTRIDLNSQHPQIKKQDFMERHIPTKDEDKFDVLSLSLVLNYVPDAGGRGKMLARTTPFLRILPKPESQGLFPSLFLVLPAPCMTNSRYMNEEVLGDMMKSLGYILQKRKLSSKLVYYLWVYEATSPRPATVHFPKKEVNPGKTRNNFCITL
ncbi:hypothetical protein NA57DRAFT_45001 [Rhizodiscina lignyota]|uniref:25S rRNA adenine-N(1) methyltransferase n=1 Tax=Rhizodiscina lignyota TaxID=1504668 RepID=A0A9P4M1Z5_9PEZI|nr:hypothetical protein NA57DRAFT_45001 [Rhizodiscina lignyota]